MKIRAYKTVLADTSSELDEKINNSIADEWQPVGGVSYFQETRTWQNERKGYQEECVDSVFTQAMGLPIDEI